MRLAAGSTTHSEARPIRKFLSAILAVALLLPILVAPVAAYNGNCVSPSSNFHSGHSNSSANVSRSGAKAFITAYPAAFEICEATPTDWDDNGSHAWVGMVPRDTSVGCQVPVDCIIQIGITECASFAQSVCGGDNAPHYFWAWGGCNGAKPYLNDLGSAPLNGGHEYSVYKTLVSGSIRWQLRIDGNLKVTINPTHSRVSCWLGGNVKATWYGERWDLGDSLGNGTSYPLTFTQMRYGIYNQGWFSPALPIGGLCQDTASDEYCWFPLTTGDGMRIHTD